MTHDDLRTLLQRAAKAIQREKMMRELLIALQQEQQSEIQTVNQLQLRIQARSLAIQALETTIRE